MIPWPFAIGENLCHCQHVGGMHGKLDACAVKNKTYKQCQTMPNTAVLCNLWIKVHRLTLCSLLLFRYNYF